MTMKRFEFREFNNPPILPKCYDTEKQEYANLFECVGWLNELHEENQSSKEFIEQLQEELMLFKEAGANMGIDLNAQITALKQENEQLKKENYKLHKRLGDFEPYERYMKERTSKTSLEDITGIVKTDEPTNSVELKKELYK